MAQTVAVDIKTINDIEKRLDKMAKEIKFLKEKLLETEPPYGSDKWWEWSDKKALEEIRAGKYTEIRNETELKEFLDSLKNEA